jgi:hypothetical protein
MSESETTELTQVKKDELTVNWKSEKRKYRAIWSSYWSILSPLIGTTTTVQSKPQDTTRPELIRQVHYCPLRHVTMQPVSGGRRLDSAAAVICYCNSDGAATVDMSSVTLVGINNELMTRALFSCENLLDFAVVALSYVFGKYCSIMY